MAEIIAMGSAEERQNLKVSEMRALTSILVERAQWMKQHGISFNGMRDLYDIFGYDRIISPAQYRQRYARGGIAGRVVDAMPKATWRGGAEIVEDENPKTDTTFEKAWKELEARLSIWAIFLKVDRLASQGRYAILLMGGSLGLLDQPLEKAKPEQLLFLTPFSEEDAPIHEWETNASEKRFGQPTRYLLNRISANSYATTVGQASVPFSSVDLQRPVHWSRVIHIPGEDALENDVFGQPTLERVWNLLDDLDKVTGGGAEAFFLRANQGIQLDIDKSVDIPPEEKVELKKQADEYSNQIRRVLRTRGVKINTLGSDVANFSTSSDAIITQIAGARGMPKRILTGSEMGELASSQDRDNWKDQVNGRQTQYAGPQIVKRSIDRFIEIGFLPPPKVYIVSWPHIEVMTEDEKASGAQKWATTTSPTEGSVFTNDEIRDKWYGMEPLPKPQTPPEALPTAGQPDNPEDIPAGALGGENTKRGQKQSPQLIAARALVVRSLQTAIEDGDQATIDQFLGVNSDPKYNVHPAWRLEPDGLTREYKFNNRRLCAAFVQALAQESNEVNHHPDIFMGDNTVRVVYVTHSAGDSVTELDWRAAAKADVIAGQWENVEDIPRVAGDYKFSSTEVRLPSQLASQLREFGMMIPEDSLTEDGREVIPHITIKYGIHTTNAADVIELLRDQPPITVTLGQTAVFEGDDADVVHIEADSPDLVRLNDILRKNLEVTDTFPKYTPHATVAYVKSGLGTQWVGDDFLDGETFTVNEIVFSPSEGEPVVIKLRKLGSFEPSQTRGAGGPGSGNFGHTGRPGEVGGSSGESQTSKAAPSYKVRKSADFSYDGIWHVTFDDGRYFPIYRDQSSGLGQWEVEGLPNAAGLVAFTKKEMIDILSNLDESKPYIDVHNGRNLGTLGEALAQIRAKVKTASSQEDLTKKYGIEEFEYPAPDSNIKHIGFAPKSKKWYGWSHRAIFGFGVGSTVRKGDVIEKEQVADPRNEGFPAGFVAKTMGDAKKMAKEFALEVSEAHAGPIDLVALAKLRDSGGAGSGNFGHAGRPGEIGGSSSESAGSVAEEMRTGIPAAVREITEEDQKKYLTPEEFEKLPPGIRKWKTQTRMSKAEGGTAKPPKAEAKPKIEPEVKPEPPKPAEPKPGALSFKDREEIITARTTQIARELKMKAGPNASTIGHYSMAAEQARAEDAQKYGAQPPSTIYNRAQEINARVKQLRDEMRDKNNQLAEKGESTFQIDSEKLYDQARKENVDKYGPWVQPDEAHAVIESDKKWSVKQAFETPRYSWTHESKTAELLPREEVIPSERSAKSERFQVAADRIAMEMGHDPSLITIRDREPRKFTLNGENLTEAGHYHPGTGQIEVNVRQSYDPVHVDGTLIHEVQHAQWDYVRSRAQDEENSLRDRWIREQQFDFRGERYFLKNGKLMAKYRSEAEQLMPHASLIARAGLGNKVLGIKPDFEGLIKDDGVSPYSKMYWTQFDQKIPASRRSKLEQGSYHADLAVNETLSETRRRLLRPRTDRGGDWQFKMQDRFTKLDKEVRNLYSKDPEMVRRFFAAKQTARRGRLDE